MITHTHTPHHPLQPLQYCIFYLISPSILTFSQQLFMYPIPNHCCCCHSPSSLKCCRPIMNYTLDSTRYPPSYTSCYHKFCSLSFATSFLFFLPLHSLNYRQLLTPTSRQTNMSLRSGHWKECLLHHPFASHLWL